MSRSIDAVCIALLLFGCLWFLLRPATIYVVVASSGGGVPGYSLSDGFTVVSSR